MLPSSSPATSEVPAGPQPPPTRFREAEARNARLGRPLRTFGRVREVDEALLDRLGRAFHERDELGHALAVAVRQRDVSMVQFRTALDQGIDAVDDAPEPLRTFFTSARTPPAWLDLDKVSAGARVLARLGDTAGDVLLQQSLIGGYRFGGPTDLLVATGGLIGPATRRRLAETQRWTVSLGSPDALVPDSPTRPGGGEGFRLTLHVRLMHALVNAKHEPTWDRARWGLPINQADLAGTLGLFDGALILGARALGVRIDADDAHALMHLWRWVGHLLGVHEDFLTDDEWERHRINYHVLLAQTGITEAGPKLAQAVVDAQRERHFDGWPASLQRLRARFEQERMLSMMTLYLGPESMRDLQLPLRLPWAPAYLVPWNVARHHVFGRTSFGKRWLETRGRAAIVGIVDSYVPPNERDHARGLGPLQHA